MVTFRSLLHIIADLLQAFANIGWRFYLVFIILSGIGTLCVYFFVPETKNIPLEEMAKLFGDDVAVLAQDIHLDHNTHELYINGHDGVDVRKIATEVAVPPGATPRNSIQGEHEKQNGVDQSRVVNVSDKV